jgi:predicted GNAT superfamily acetyltransferase
VGVGELREAARALVLRVADGDDVSIEALREFAALTLRCELVQLAHRLQDAPPGFAARRAMDLAGLILTLSSTPSAADGSSEPDAVVDDISVVADPAEGEGSAQ